jgi:hypothetical protein
MRWFALLAVMAVLGGCLEDPAPDAEAQLEPADEDPGRVARQGRDRDDPRQADDEEERTGEWTLRAYTDEFGATLTSANAIIAFTVGEYDCVAVEGAPFSVLNGTATLTWSSQSALTDAMDIEVRTDFTGSIERASGPSPLVVEFKDIDVEADPDDGEDVLRFAIQLNGPANAAYEQDVTLALAFHYESDIDVDAYLTYC